MRGVSLQIRPTCEASGFRQGLEILLGEMHAECAAVNLQIHPTCEANQFRQDLEILLGEILKQSGRPNGSPALHITAVTAASYVRDTVSTP